MRHSLFAEDLGREEMPRLGPERRQNAVLSGDFAEIMRQKGEVARLCGSLVLQGGG
jgi:hypothetical protein